MNDEALRQRVQERMADGRLPRALAGSERRHLEKAVAFIGEPEFPFTYREVRRALRPPQASGAGDRRGRAEVRELLHHTPPPWAKLRAELASFVCKHDYRNKEALVKTETASHRLAFEVLAGAPGLFRNDRSFPPAVAPRGRPKPSERRATGNDGLDRDGSESDTSPHRGTSG